MRSFTSSRTRPERPEDAGAARKARSVGSLPFCDIRLLPFQPLAHENPTARPWLLYSTLREARPELDERRAQPPRLELGHAPHELLEVRLRDVLEVVQISGDVEDRGPELRGPVRLDPFEQALLAGLRDRRSPRRPRTAGPNSAPGARRGTRACGPRPVRGPRRGRAAPRGA